MTDRHYTTPRTTDLRAGLERAFEMPFALAATGTDTLTPKLTPATASNGVFRGATRGNAGVRNTTAGKVASGCERGDNAQRGTSVSNGVQHPVNHGPVAQRPTGDSKKQARNGKVPKGLPTKLPPDSDAVRTASAGATDPLALMVATLSPSQRERLRALLGGVVGG